MKKILLSIALLAVSSTVFAAEPVTCTNNSCLITGTVAMGNLSDRFLLNCPQKTAAGHPVTTAAISATFNEATSGTFDFAFALSKDINTRVYYNRGGANPSGAGLYSFSISKDVTKVLGYKITASCYGVDANDKAIVSSANIIQDTNF